MMNYLYQHRKLPVFGCRENVDDLWGPIHFSLQGESLASTRMPLRTWLLHPWWVVLGRRQPATARKQQKKLLGSMMRIIRVIRIMRMIRVIWIMRMIRVIRVMIMRSKEVQRGGEKWLCANNLHVIPVDVIPSTKSWSIPSGNWTVVMKLTLSDMLSASIRFQGIKSETLRNLIFSSQILDLTSTSPKPTWRQCEFLFVGGEICCSLLAKKSPGGAGALMERQW